MQKSANITDLILRYLREDISPEEKLKLDAWASEDPARSQLLQQLQNKEHVAAKLSQFDSYHHSNALGKIIAEFPELAMENASAAGSINETESIRPDRSGRIYWLRYAAAVMLVIGVAAYFWNTGSKTEPKFANSSNPLQKEKDIAPGGNKAVLTLADGTTIALDNAATGAIAEQGNAQVVKLANGQITYRLKGMAEGQVMLNTMSTPRGGQYQLMLPDGTKVWLNAASSITYPAVFVGKERNVKVTGEAYFEVAKNSNMPFRVKMNDNTDVEVLGTQFNVNAYTDEASINTTLLEGSVNIHTNNNQQKLVPGQQARVSSSDIKVMDDVNTDQGIAWKNGAFSFKNDDLSGVLRQLSRWYDVEFDYKGGVSERKFSGKMGRDLTLSQVLNFLREVKLNFDKEGKKIIVRE